MQLTLTIKDSKHKVYRGIGKTGQYSKPRDIVRTPYWLIYKMMQLANIKHNEKILDPCFGDGRIINRVMCICNLELKIYGIEIDENQFNNYKNKHATLYNCSFLDDFPNFNEYKYDVIIMNPPFSHCGAWKFVEKGLKLLSSNGRIITIFPSYLITQNKDRAKSINKHLHSIYALPRDTFKAHGAKVIDGFLCEFRLTTDSRCGCVFPEDK
jgi:type I restriction-modification system DNA methylase subunit